MNMECERETTVQCREEISLSQIAQSGQCFRWTEVKREDGQYWWRIPAFRRVVYMRQEDREMGRLHVSCSRDEFEHVWAPYLDWDTDYRAIRAGIPENDVWLRGAAEKGAGIRILRQDPWEMMITFILSQRKNIPAIRLCVDKLCRAAGDLLGEFDGEEVYAFPTPAQVLSLRCHKIGAGSCSADDAGPCTFAQKGIGSCSLGYRMPYVHAAAVFAAGGDDGGLSDAFRELASLSDEDLLTALMQIKGIGIKVASCIALFGYHRLNTFPVDVWMKRALAEHYPKDFSIDAFSPYAGVLQQYMFCAQRAEGAGRR